MKTNLKLIFTKIWFFNSLAVEKLQENINMFQQQRSCMIDITVVDGMVMWRINDQE